MLRSAKRASQRSKATPKGSPSLKPPSPSPWWGGGLGPPALKQLHLVQRRLCRSHSSSICPLQVETEGSEERLRCQGRCHGATGTPHISTAVGPQEQPPWLRAWERCRQSPELEAERDPLGWGDKPCLPGPILPQAPHHETVPSDTVLRANSSGLRSCLSHR